MGRTATVGAAAAAPAAVLPALGERTTSAGERRVEPTGYYTEAWRRFRRDRTSLAALCGFVLVCLIALAAPAVSTHIVHTDPNKQNLEARFHPPSARYLLGADEYGRDQ